MPPPPLGLSTPVRIERVIDGDTVVVTIERQVTVRLLECWAPETRTADPQERRRGRASAAHLATLLPPQTPATLYVPGSADGHVADLLTFGRVLGRIWCPGAECDVSALQVAAGHATPDKVAAGRFPPTSPHF